MLLICLVFGTKLHAKVVICFRFEHLDMHSAHLVSHYLSSKRLLFRSGKLQSQTKPMSIPMSTFVVLMDATLQQSNIAPTVLAKLT